MAMAASSETIFNIRQSLHQLAQPLSVLTGLVDLLLLELDQSDPTFQEVRQMNEQLERVLHIVNEMHRMAREATVPAEPVSLDSWAHPKS